jgi:HPt (histidine-containing phosphotransfer) domain-containing protein
MPEQVLSRLSEVIDEKALMTRCLDNLEFAERILKLFHGRCEADLVELEKAIESGELDAVSRVAHRLTGACANAGAFGLQSRAADLKNAAGEVTAENIAAAFGELRKEWSRFDAAFVGDSSQNRVAT